MQKVREKIKHKGYLVFSKYKFLSGYENITVLKLLLNDKTPTCQWIISNFPCVHGFFYFRHFNLFLSIENILVWNSLHPIYKKEKKEKKKGQIALSPLYVSGNFNSPLYLLNWAISPFIFWNWATYP